MNDIFYYIDRETTSIIEVSYSKNLSQNIEGFSRINAFVAPNVISVASFLMPRHNVITCTIVNNHHLSSKGGYLTDTYEYAQRCQNSLQLQKKLQKESKNTPLLIKSKDDDKYAVLYKNENVINCIICIQNMTFTYDYDISGTCYEIGYCRMKIDNAGRLSVSLIGLQYVHPQYAILFVNDKEQIMPISNDKKQVIILDAISTWRHAEMSKLKKRCKQLNLI